MRLADVLDLDTALDALDQDGDGKVEEEEVIHALAAALDCRALGAIVGGVVAGPGGVAGGAVVGALAESADLDEVALRGLARGIRVIASLVGAQARAWRHDAPERRAERRARRAARRGAR